MARERSQDEILDQLVYAVAAIARWYGPGLNANGLKCVRDCLADQGPWFCDSSWRVDIPDGEEKDFCPGELKDGIMELSLTDVATMSKTGEELNDEIGRTREE